jgi:hypothetical protein
MRHLLPVFILASCGGTPNPNTNDNTQVGYGKPTLEVTVNGVHSGPAAPDGNSFFDYVNQYDSNGTLTRSSVQIVASSTAANASCSLAADRYGNFLTPFGVGQYSLGGSSVNGTGDGVAAPVGAPAAATSAGLFSCTGSACGAVGLSITWIDAGHAEGFFGGTMSGADVICSFYLPTRTFRP